LKKPEERVVKSRSTSTALFERGRGCRVIRVAKSNRDRLMFDLTYFGGCESRNWSVDWAQGIRRHSDDAQKTTSAYAHARLVESGDQYLKTNF